MCVHVESSKFCKKDMKHALVLWYYCSSAPHTNEQALWILSLLKNTHNALSLLSSQLALFILYPFKAQTPGECIHLYNHVLTRETEEEIHFRFLFEWNFHWFCSNWAGKLPQFWIELLSFSRHLKSQGCYRKDTSSLISISIWFRIPKSHWNDKIGLNTWFPC